MHYLKGKHRWAVALGIVLILTVIAVVAMMVSGWDSVPYAPGPYFTPDENLGM